MGIEPSPDFVLKCDACGNLARAQFDAEEVIHWVTRDEALAEVTMLKWSRAGDKFYCPACGPKLALPKAFVLALPVVNQGDYTRGNVISPVDGRAIIYGHENLARPAILTAMLPVLLAAEVSAAAVRIAYDAIARPADFNRGEILALLAQALRAAEPEVRP